MFGSNPYAQAGWYNPQNPHSINGGPWRPKTSLPPTFGALPPLDQQPSSVLEFEFTSFSPDIYNCIIIGPKQRKFFEIRTTSNMTIISKPDEQFALIKWSHHPTIEARGALSLQRTGEFLKLSLDSTCVIFLFVSLAILNKHIVIEQWQSPERHMFGCLEITVYMWVWSSFFVTLHRCLSYSQLQLYSGGPNPPEQFARIRLSGDATKVVLEITSEAFQVGLFEPCIVSTMLLFSGRNIDWSRFQFLVVFLSNSVPVSHECSTNPILPPPHLYQLRFHYYTKPLYYTSRHCHCIHIFIYL